MDATTTAPPRRLTLRCQFCLTWNRVDPTRAADRPKCGQCAKPMLLDRPVKVDDETFDRTVQESTLPVLVDFYADWCGPCKAMAPAVDQLAARTVGRALVTKLDTDHARKTAGRFQIAGVPTVMIFRDGAEAVRHTGAVPLAGLIEMMGRAGLTV